MKILITSDTHGSYSKVSDFIIERGDIDLMLHAGDGVEDCQYIGYETGVVYYVVKGNNDFFTNEPYEKIIDLEGIRILLTHGHKNGVDFSLRGLLAKAIDKSCDLVIFGHTHTYTKIKESGILFLNPGSVSLPRDGQASMMLMTLDKEKMDIEKISL